MILRSKLSLCVAWAMGSPTTALWPVVAAQCAAITLMVACCIPTAAAAAAEENEILLQRVLARIENRVQALSAYKCRLSTVCILGKIVEKRTYNYYFSKPGLVRMEIIQGKDKGAVLVYKQGIVYARRFPLFFTLRFKPHSRMVTTIRGGQVDQTDLGFILSILKAPGRGLSWQGKEELNGQTLEVIELRDDSPLGARLSAKPREAEGKAKPGEPQKGFFWVGQDGFILKYELYDINNNLVFLQSHDSIQPEAGFSHSLFKL